MTNHWKELSIVSLAVAMISGLYFGMTWVPLAPYGGIGESPKGRIAAEERQLQWSIKATHRSLSELTVISNSFEKGRRFVEKGSRYSHREYPVYAPQFIDWPEPYYTIGKTRSFAEADHSWHLFRSQRSHWQRALDMTTRQRAAYSRAKGAPPLSLRTAAEGFAAGLVVALGVLSANVLVNWWRVLSQRARRISRRVRFG
jgi:hypothetical protein